MYSRGLRKAVALGGGGLNVDRGHCWLMGAGRRLGVRGAMGAAMKIKDSDYLFLAMSVWIAPHAPYWLSDVIGVSFAVLCLVFKWKEWKS